MKVVTLPDGRIVVCHGVSWTVPGTANTSTLWYKAPVQQIALTAVCYIQWVKHVQNAHVVVLIVHEYLTAWVKQERKTVKINELDF